jgi:hypothetical protein
VFGCQGRHSAQEHFPLSWLLGQLGQVLPGFRAVRIGLYRVAQEATGLGDIPLLRRDLAGFQPHLGLFA